MKHHDDNLPEDPDFSFHKGEEGPFGLPSDYFASFEEKLRSKLEAEQELKDFPVLSSIQKSPVFEVPGNYFSEAEKVVELKAELAAYPVLEGLAKPAFNAPEEDYEKRLSESLTYKISLLDELKPYQTLNAIDKINAFAVSDVYFDSVADRVKERIYSGNAEQVSVLDRIWNIVFGGKTAWAFGLALIIGLAFFFNRKTEISSDLSDCKTLACLERDEILSNEAITNFDEEQLIDLVDVNSFGKQLNLNTKKDTLSGTELILQNTDTEDLLDAL